MAVINGSGQTLSDRYGYDPYGNTTYQSVTVPNPFGYAGGYTDATGLVHFGARYYDPSTARWMQLDPGTNGESSAYSYANDDPLNILDPTGTIGENAGFRSYSNGWLGLAPLLSLVVPSIPVGSQVATWFINDVAWELADALVGDNPLANVVVDLGLRWLSAQLAKDASAKGGEWVDLYVNTWGPGPGVPYYVSLQTYPSL